jgi:UDP-GlcNAc:undecaprenyl-phosphate GlcNAc-1-phosphate transferase
VGPGVVGYLIVIGAAFATSFAAMPFLRRLAVRVGALDMPDARRVHTTLTPIMGGVGVGGRQVVRVSRSASDRRRRPKGW